MNNNLQNKLSHFETPPPESVWNKIVDALDENVPQAFPQRLFQYEEQPPAGSWKKIESKLEEPSLKAVPIRRFKKPLRYAAAAASIAAIYILVANITNKQAGAGSLVGGTTPATTTTQSAIIPLNKPTPVQKEGQVAFIEKTAPLEEAAPPSRRRREVALLRPQAISQSISLLQQFVPRKAAKEELLDWPELDHFMIYSDGNGNAMRVPKKLFHLVNCDDHDETCRERIRQLQKKMAASATTTDFGGVLEILRQLQ
jgi:hypothetical protein